MKKQWLIEADIPEGWEPVAFRPAKIGESVLFGDGVMVAEHDWKSRCIILRPVHVWPEWLMEIAASNDMEFVVVDRDGSAVLYEVEPVENHDTVTGWDGGEWFFIPTSVLPPHDHTGDNWKHCKWRLRR